MTHEKNHLHNGRVVKWLVDKILPWVLMVVISAVIGFGIETALWRVTVNDKLSHLEEDKRDLINTVREMKVKMDIALSTAAGGHMTHREGRFTHQGFERRLELLSEFHIKRLSRIQSIQDPTLEDQEDKSN